MKFLIYLDKSSMLIFSVLSFLLVINLATSYNILNNKKYMFFYKICFVLIVILSVPIIYLNMEGHIGNEITSRFWCIFLCAILYGFNLIWRG